MRIIYYQRNNILPFELHNYILPKRPCEVCFEEAIVILSKSSVKKVLYLIRTGNTWILRKKRTKILLNTLKSLIENA